MLADSHASTQAASVSSCGKVCQSLQGVCIQLVIRWVHIDAISCFETLKHFKTMLIWLYNPGNASAVLVMSGCHTLFYLAVSLSKQYSYFLSQSSDFFKTKFTT